MKTDLKNKKVGLALGGGAVLGAAHVGVLKALAEFDIKVDYIAGTSIGAFVAAFYAFGKKWDEIETLAEGLNWFEISGLSLSRFGLMSNQKLGKLIVDTIGEALIEHAEIPLAMIATDISNGKKVVLKKGPVDQAAMASTCLPGIFNPVEIDKQLLVDGGIVENVPIDTLRSMGADYIIGVDLNAEHKYEKPGNIIDVLINSFHFTMMAASRLQTEEADLLIKPDLSEFSRSDTSKISELIEQGYRDAYRVLENKFDKIK